MMQKINCLEFRDTKMKEIKERVESMIKKPSLLIIKVGDDQASNKYVSNKIKRCEDVGISVELIQMPENVTESDIITTLTLHQPEHNAVIIQEPLPKHIDSKTVNSYIYNYKDCDGLTEENIGRLFNQRNCITPATPQGIVNLFDFMNVDLSGKEVLVIGRSNLVGRPLAELMLQEDATVTIAHSRTKNLEEKVASGRYDIIVSCVGKAKFLKGAKAEYLIDVGINLDENGKMCGDFDIDTCDCEYYTSVPGGVGLLTQATIVENIIKCFQLQY